MAQLTITKFNNYYNRKVRIITKESDEFINPIYILPEANFNPNDGITTSHIFGNNVSIYDGSGDYLVVQNSNSEIMSRWFIIEARRLRGGQWSLQLKRDVIADYFYDIIDSPVFIEKANLTNSDPLIFNSEDMSFNEIKTAEYPIKDKTNCPWIVGYFDAKKNSEEAISIGSENPTDMNYDKNADITVESSITDWEYYNLINSNTNVIKNSNIYSIFNHNSAKAIEVWESSSLNGTRRSFISTSSSATKEAVDYLKKITNNSLTGYSVSRTNTTLETSYTPGDNKNIITSEGVENAFKSKYGIINTILFDYLPLSTYSEREKILSLDNKTIKFVNSNGTSEFYEINVSIVPNKLYLKTSGNLQIELEDILKSVKYITSNNTEANAYSSIGGTNDIFYLVVDTEKITIEATKVEPITHAYCQFPKKDLTLSDAPYGMFAMPCPEFGKTVNINVLLEGTVSETYPITREMSLCVANKLIEKYYSASTPVIYDVQLLPFCPMPGIVKDDGTIVLNSLNNNYTTCRFIKGKGSNTEISFDGVCIFPFSASFSTEIDFGILNTVENIKIQSQTDFCRVVSPNYNGQFEFNIAKNGGLKSFNIDCTYKPFNPYIHINPNFGRLYGTDFNDVRGLICAGDFGLALANSKWSEYEIQNKNYQNIFDRQIQNLEVKNNIQREVETVSAVAGALQATAAGAATGGMLGGPAGAVAGGIIAGGVSAIAGAYDVELNDKLRAENIDYLKDQFGYNLGNIKALPQSLSRVSSFNINNKIFPIVEYYTCTDEEKIAFANKIAYNGMTVMTIGKIKDYLMNQWSYKDIQSQNYIKGKLIRLETIPEDYHIVSEISSELSKGVFL